MRQQSCVSVPEAGEADVSWRFEAGAEFNAMRHQNSVLHGISPDTSVIRQAAQAERASWLLGSLIPVPVTGMRELGEAFPLNFLLALPTSVHRRFSLLTKFAPYSASSSALCRGSAAHRRGQMLGTSPSMTEEEFADMVSPLEPTRMPLHSSFPSASSVGACLLRRERRLSKPM